MRSAAGQRRGLARVLLVFLLAFSFPAPGVGEEGGDGLPDSLKDYRLANFYIDTDLAGALEGLAGIARARGGNLFALVDRKVVRALPVKVKLREGINLAEAVAELARVYGYSCHWDLSAGVVVIGNEQSFRDYETMETRLYDPGRYAPEEFLKVLAAVVPRQRLEIAASGGLLQVTTSSLEHRIIGEKVSALRGWEEAGVTLRIKVKTFTVDGGGIRGLSVSRLSGPYFARLSREELAEANALAGGETPEETFTLQAVLYKRNRQFIGELLPEVAAGGKGKTTATSQRPIGITLDLTYLGKTEESVILALQAEVNRIVDWQETAGGTSVPVLATEEAGAVLSLREEEGCLLSGPALTPGGSWGRAADYIRPGSPRAELVFGKGQMPGEKRDLAVLIDFFPGEAGVGYPSYTHTAGEGTRPVPPGAGTPAGAGEAKEEETLKTAESTAPVESTAMWEAEVIELGSLGQAGGPAPGPVKPETPAPLAGEEAAAEKTAEAAGGEKPAVEEDKETAAGAGPELYLPGTAKVGLIITYKTKEGEDLPVIAGKYGIPVEALSRANNLSPDAPLPAGTSLVVPIPVDHLYVLQPGETLWRLARRYGVTSELLMEINQISDATQLMNGQIIILPKPVDQASGKN